MADWRADKMSLGQNIPRTKRPSDKVRCYVSGPVSTCYARAYREQWQLWRPPASSGMTG